MSKEKDKMKDKNIIIKDLVHQAYKLLLVHHVNKPGVYAELWKKGDCFRAKEIVNNSNKARGKLRLVLGLLEEKLNSQVSGKEKNGR